MKQYPELYIQQKNQAVTLGSERHIKVGGEDIDVDPQLLFQRIITVSNSTVEDVEDLFQYELCAYPAALFDSSGLMREADKPQLANAIWNMGECGEGDIPKDCAFVVDGGSLLHRIPWVQGYSFGMIYEEYCKFVSSNYGKPHIKFDGYNMGPSTKDAYSKDKGKSRD